MFRKLAVPIVIAAVLLAILSYKLFHPGPANQDIRIGWQTAWATQGQIIQAMVHTNIAQRYGSNPQFRPFQYGPDLNQAAITDDIDCTNSGIVPTITLLDKTDGKWIVVARMVDFPISVVARPESGVRSISDLKGRNFAVPLGGGSHPYALQLLKDNGLVIGEGPERVRVKNVQPTEMALAMNQKSVEASAVWEPVRSLLLRQGGSVIAETRYVGFVAIRRSFAKLHPGRVVALLKSYIDANFYVAEHRAETDAWFAEASNMDLALISSIKVIEPNLQAKSIQDVNIRVSDGDLLLAQKVAARMRDLDLIRRLPRFADYVDMSYLDRALRELANNQVKTAAITVQKPRTQQ